MEYERMCFYAEEEGRKKGLEEGLAEGESRGAQQTKLETAKRSLEINLPIETIVQITGLSLEQVQQIKAEHFANA